MPRPRAVSLFLQISWRVHVHSSVERRSYETGETRAAFSHARGHCRILCVLLDGLRKKRDCSCLLLMCFVFRTEPNAKREWHSSDLWRTARDNVKEKNERRRVSRPFSPSRLSLRAIFHQKRDCSQTRHLTINGWGCLDQTNKIVMCQLAVSYSLRYSLLLLLRHLLWD